MFPSLFFSHFLYSLYFLLSPLPSFPLSPSLTSPTFSFPLFPLHTFLLFLTFSFPSVSPSSLPFLLSPCFPSPPLPLPPYPGIPLTTLPYSPRAIPLVPQVNIFPPDFFLQVGKWDESRGIKGWGLIDKQEHREADR